MSYEIKEIRWPFGAASSKALSATGAQAITIDNNVTIINGVTTAATGNRTINLTVDPMLAAGAMLFIKSKTAGTETTIPGTKMQGTTITGVAGKTKTTLYIYDGANFVESGTPVQID
jgi:hypothetical protein